jgi:NAD(P)-dependent dehydrogenase (short-subunit alcohol dehydrogenase family)
VQALDAVGRVDDAADLLGEGEKRDHAFPGKSTPYSSRRCRWMSRVVIPPAYNARICSSKPAKERPCLGTIRGSKDASRSRGSGLATALRRCDHRALVALSDLFDLGGRVAIVTGGGAGLGRVFADALAEAGASVVVCGRNAERCEQAAAEIAEAHGGRAIGLRCDVRTATEIEAVVERAVAELGSIDVLVNNAGTSWGAVIEDYPLEGWQKVIDVNLTGLFQGTKLVGRTMIEQGRGKIVNVASVAAFAGARPGLMDAVAYNASKGGVVAFTRDVAVKWARHGITVNAIAPGWFPTDMSRQLLERAGDVFLERIPLGRFGAPDDLRGTIVFLAGRASDFVTGQTLIVDGGQSAS